MGEEDDLKTVHQAGTLLRHAAGVEDGADEREFNSEHRLRAENLAFDIDVWYRPLSAFTFETVFLPLLPREAVALVHMYDVFWRKRSAETVTRDDVAVLRALEDRIDKTLACPPFGTSRQGLEKSSSTNGAFLRLCGRSPKDGEPLDRTDVWNRYKENLRCVCEDEEGVAVVNATGNMMLRAVSRTTTLHVRSGRDAMALLCSSERVFLDMIDWLKYGEPEQVVLRAWDENVKIENEFRAFICNNRLCALSQYDHYTVYPHLFQRRKRIEAAVRTLWARMHERVGVHSYCADFFVDPLTETAKLIEISPFLPCTGPALFHWSLDRAVLHGEKPFELRLRERERDHVKELVQATWHTRWDPNEGSSAPILAYDNFFSQMDKNGASDMNHKQILSVLFTTIISMAGYLISMIIRSLYRTSRSLKSSIRSEFLVSSTEDGSQKGNSGELLFVYGTLKRMHHWHNKFLSEAQFVCNAETEEAIPLVVGNSGVPYLLQLDNSTVEHGEDLHANEASRQNEGLKVRGEIWKVSIAQLQGMDDYEGCSKGYYTRVQRKCRSMEVNGDHASELLVVWMYMKSVTSKSDLELCSLPRIAEYTKTVHDEQYRPIKHILVKQQGYLCRRASTWGLSDAVPSYNDAKS